MKRKRSMTGLIAVAVGLVSVFSAQAQNTWSGTGDWFANTANWSGGLPMADDVVIIAAGSNLQLTNNTPALTSLTMQGGTLTCSKWATAINATTVTLNGGTVTCTGPFDETAGSSNRVYITCTDFFLASVASINVAEKGYEGGWGSGDGKGPGGSLAGGAPPGAGHGGKGGPHGANSGAPNGAIYGLTNAPTAPGSGSGGWGSVGHGGHGGGAVRIAATGAVAVNGTINVNGGASFNQSGVSGGGSGGSIYISCNTFSGTNGLLAANGGAAGTHGWSPGGGAGGRIAVDYSPVAQANLPVKPTVTFSANRGTANSGHLGESGTLFFKDDADLSGLLAGGTPVFGNAATSWTLQNLTVSGEVSIPAGLNLYVTDDLVLTNAGVLYVYADATNGVTPAYGALVSVGSDLVVYTNSWIYPVSNPTNGGSARFTVGNLTVPTANAGMDASGRGWQGAQPGAATKHGWGPGRGLGGTYPQGGGYGGRGGNTTAPGNVYGVSNQPPVSAGSGGGAYENNPSSWAGNGGGLIWIEAVRMVTLNGELLADGKVGYHISNLNSGGSGGGIYITCSTLAGNGTLSVKGANGGGHHLSAGGGGGRILVFRKSGDPLTNVFFTGGTIPSATAGAAGSVHWELISPAGTVISIK